jgi:soluble lytic murein transglycosylase
VKYGNERSALAAYNAGQSNVDRWLEAGEGIQFPETRQYVDEVLEARGVYADAYADELGLDR